MQQYDAILNNRDRLIDKIQSKTARHVLPHQVYPENWQDLANASAVLFLLGYCGCGNGKAPEPCLILNKRSDKVRQPGDLCCPGGGIMPKLDPLMSKTLNLPGFPMAGWPLWKELKTENIGQAHMLRSLLATCLRESFEEMRLIPLDVMFLGPLPSQDLVLFKRTIYPLAGWLGHQKRFFPNWEVDKIIYIPIRKLLDPSRYRQYQYCFTAPGTNQAVCHTYDAPCYLHQNHHETEVLWGATCRITLNFLKIVFGFTPPDVSTLPVVKSDMNANYLGGKPT
jgi:8-oxo-dGTP pyrophosphatase MutT (NUDIX family)